MDCTMKYHGTVQMKSRIWPEMLKANFVLLVLWGNQRLRTDRKFDFQPSIQGRNTIGIF